MIAFFRAVLHKLYGNPNSHFYLRSIGIHYLANHPKRGEEQNREEGEMAQTKLGGGRNRRKK